MKKIVLVVVYVVMVLFHRVIGIVLAKSGGEIVHILVDDNDEEEKHTF